MSIADIEVSKRHAVLDVDILAVMDAEIADCRTCHKGYRDSGIRKK